MAIANTGDTNDLYVYLCQWRQRVREIHRDFFLKFIDFENVLTPAIYGTCMVDQRGRIRPCANRLRHGWFASSNSVGVYVLATQLEKVVAVAEAALVWFAHVYDVTYRHLWRKCARVYALHKTLVHFSRVKHIKDGGQRRALQPSYDSPVHVLSTMAANAWIRPIWKACVTSEHCKSCKWCR